MHVVTLRRHATAPEVAVEVPDSVEPAALLALCFAEVDAAAQNCASFSPAPGVRDTSMHAYRALQASGKLGAQEKLVMQYFIDHPGAKVTRQELARALMLGINAVCGRVNALMKEPFNLLVERGKKVCPITRQRVNAVELA